jgi:hypothetical protein
MQYCYHCSEPISKPAKICPHCKRTLDMDAFESLLADRDSSHLSKKSLRKIWRKEHSYLFWPLFTLVIGFIIGGILAYGFAQFQFASERQSYEDTISGLEQQIQENQNDANNAQAGLASQLAAKDNIINILDEQKELLTRIINFSRSFAQNSIITPNSDAIANRFKRNFDYLNDQFTSEQEKLRQTDHENIRRYNLQTIPQVLSD